MKKVMCKPEYLELGQEALEELRLEAIERFKEDYPDKPIPEYKNKTIGVVNLHLPWDSVLRRENAFLQL